MDYSTEPRGIYLMVDNKSFYATVECVARGLDPLTTPLVVMSEAANVGQGLILSSSPAAKRLFGLHNVNRARDLPVDERLLVVPPRMNLYLAKNLAINEIFREFVADEDLLPYSIDESLLNLTHSWRLKSDNLLTVVRQLQTEIKQRLQLVVTIGVGNNPLQAKVALDIYAKHSPVGIGIITNHTAPVRLWAIPELTMVWGINTHLAQRLQRLGLHNLKQVAHADPYQLKAALGQNGARLYATAWGVDRTTLSRRSLRRAQSIGNSQVLPRDYVKLQAIKVVIAEITAQVAARLRARHKQAGGVRLQIGYAFGTVDQAGRAGFAHAQHLSALTADERKLTRVLQALFDQYWTGQPVRHVAIAVTHLSPAQGEQLDLFATKAETLALDVAQTVDQIRQRFGKTAIMKASSLTTGATFLARAQQVGGHNGGQSFE
ncbi:excinuclease ABC subunit A [Limosilactobacillus ingluviei]|uniref:Nucleotidyltransferase DNA polymerase for DNA repair n=1 Tax=Limosilactobacillus ingluviei DSM 15946 TaxID=1423760 RepID=A0A0R1UEM9_9LACO|nr:excinuclease ABC subunit A [Limosilactobacillus ingluviei]KRL89416.1 nucleotidyltransferase DNA polymerase for DNA repair [Limosilactobacillus ingluviei DSM 15946]